MGWNLQPTRSSSKTAGCPTKIGSAGRRRLQDRNGGTRRRLAQHCGLLAVSGQAALDKALAYMKERKAFGKRLNEFPLQFRLSDIATELEAARTLLWRAASALDAKEPDETRLCAIAKRFVTDIGFHVANDALQMFGEYGYLADYGVEKIDRDLRVHQILEARMRSCGLSSPVTCWDGDESGIAVLANWLKTRMPSAWSEWRRFSGRRQSPRQNWRLVFDSASIAGFSFRIAGRGFAGHHVNPLDAGRRDIAERPGSPASQRPGGRLNRACVSRLRFRRSAIDAGG